MSTVLLHRTAVAVLLFCAREATDSGAQTRRGAIYIQVVDTAVNPLGGTEIILPHVGLSMRLDDEAALLLTDVPNGWYLVQARLVGFRSEWQVVRVGGDTARARFTLAPEPYASNSDVSTFDRVEQRLSSFLHRSTTTPTGYFLTREDVDRRNSTDVGTLLETVSGVAVQRTPSGPTFIRSRRATDVRCNAGMLVFVDGYLVNAPPTVSRARARGARTDSLAARRPRTSVGLAAGRGASRGSWGRLPLGPVPVPTVDPSSGTPAELFDLDRVPLSTLAGVEVYPTVAGVPAEFRVPGSECGVVLLWTAT